MFNTKISREFIYKSFVRIITQCSGCAWKIFWRTTYQSKLAKGSENYTFWPAIMDLITSMLSRVAVFTSRSVPAGVILSTLFLKMYKRNARKCDHTLPRSRSKQRAGETILCRQGRVDGLLKVMFWRLINWQSVLSWRPYSPAHVTVWIFCTLLGIYLATLTLIK